MQPHQPELWITQPQPPPPPPIYRQLNPEQRARLVQTLARLIVLTIRPTLPETPQPQSPDEP